jgi:transcriptional regulator with XRE-family HTH domain
MRQHLRDQLAKMEIIDRPVIDIQACLREIRKVRGFRQDEIADVIHKAVITYSKIETGESPLKVRDMLKLCDFYRVSPNDLLGWRNV